MTSTRRLRGRVLARWLAAAAALACFAGPPAARRGPGPAPARLGGTLGLPAALRLAAVPDGAAVRLDLAVLPGADLPGARVEFVLPRGWTALAGAPAERMDLVAGREVIRTLWATREAGAPPMAAARVRCGALARETYGSVEPWTGAPFEGSVLDRDVTGRAARVFRLGEGR